MSIIMKLKQYRLEIIAVIATVIFNFALYYPWGILLMTPMILTAILGAFLGEKLLSPILLSFHKKFFGKNLSYGIQDRPTPEKFKNPRRIFFPTLFSLNLALILVTTPIISQILGSFTIDLLSLLYGFTVTISGFHLSLYSIFVISSLTTGISFFIFSGVYTLIDSGISYSNKEKVKEQKKTIEVRNIGGTFYNILKGWAGLGVIVAFLQFLSKLNFELSGGFSFGNFIWFSPLLLVFLGFSIPGIVLLDIRIDKREKFMKEIAKNKDIIDELEININFHTLR